MSSSFVVEILSNQANAQTKAQELANLGFTVTGPTQFDFGSLAYEENGNLKTMTKHSFGAAWVVFGQKVPAPAAVAAGS